MNERIMEFRVGVMILATFLIAVILVMLFTDSSPLQSTARTRSTSSSTTPRAWPAAPRSARPASASARCGTCSLPTMTPG